VFDYVVHLNANETIGFMVKGGDIDFWESETNQLGCYLTIEGWGEK
jgi:hypothetical protein